MFDELDEEETPGMTIADLTKQFKNFEVPKGFARTSFMLASKRYNDDLKIPPEQRKPMKKVINRLHYQYIEALDKAKDPAVMLAALNFIHDRLDGKSAQSVNLGDHEGKALTLMVQASDTRVL